MEKKFKLPKPFAIQWLEALRSGKYIQSTGMLTKNLFPIGLAPTAVELDNYGFCCLGVAGHICGNPIENMTTGFLYSNKGEPLVNIPDEIIKPYESALEVYPFINILGHLNDGLSKTSTLSGCIIRPEIYEKIDKSLSEAKDYQFSFSEIADFIEDNTEFYETEIQ